MNTIFKIMAFSIMLNISIGIMMEALPVFDAIPVARGGLDYQTGYTDVFTGELEDELNPTSTLREQTDNFAYGLLDMIGLGVISRFLKTITDYAYGFVKLLDKLLGPLLLDNVETVGLYNILFGRGMGAGMGVLYLLMTIGYVWGAIYLWTGKDLRT